MPLFRCSECTSAPLLLARPFPCSHCGGALVEAQPQVSSANPAPDTSTSPGRVCLETVALRNCSVCGQTIPAALEACPACDATDSGGHLGGRYVIAMAGSGPLHLEEGATLTIGRSRDSDLVIPSPPFGYTSRQHVEVTLLRSRLEIIDLSANGTCVSTNDQPGTRLARLLPRQVEASPGAPVTLVLGGRADEVTIGRYARIEIRWSPR